MTAPASGDPFAAALEAENMAIFGYGVLGARLDDAGKVAARQAETTHRDQRDALLTKIMASGATPAPAPPAYELPFPVTDQDSALRLAIAIEDGVALAWRRALASTTAEDRKAALDALMAAAVQSTRWREVAGITPLTVPFPGTPD
jgi:hypothetical protein